MFVSSQHIQDPWLLSSSDVERQRAVDTILSLLQTFRDNMLLTVGGVSSNVRLIDNCCKTTQNKKQKKQNKKANAK